MIVIPSLDLIKAQCVRLLQGDFNQTSVYKVTPLSMVKAFNTYGIKNLHVVDLDGAKQGSLTQTEVLSQVISEFEGDIQVGGGIRKSSDIEALFSMGAKRIVIGTSAIKNISKAKAWFKEFGAERIVLALDFKLKKNVPEISISAWQEETSQSLWDILETFKNLKYVLCTDIRKDGMESGPNFNFYKECVERYPSLSFQASGGIRSLEDILKLKKTGVKSSIVGKAIYENKISIQEISKPF